jgi:hypothetical protein
LITGAPLIGLSAYMFDRSIPRALRVLSLFHVGLPLLLLWMIHRLGYDERAVSAQTIVAMIVLPLSYRCGDPKENINWVYGFGGKPQTRVPAIWFLLFVIVMFPIAIYLPTHFILDRLFLPAKSVSYEQPIQFSPKE